MFRKTYLLSSSLFLALSLLTNFSCQSSSRGADFGTVFPSDKVNRIDIIIPPDDWKTIFDDMTLSFGEFGAGKGLGSTEFWDIYYTSLTSPEGNPPWVPCTITFNGRTWNHVGIRLKGSSSLARAWWFGSMKLPFRLDFDQFETEYPDTENQRFFGFKELSFSNLINDETYLRHKVAADLMREEGVAAPHSAFYRVFFDTGEGPAYIGLYTMVEYPQKTMYETQFGGSGGNLYRPGTSSLEAWRQERPADSRTFPKKNNEEADDYSDVEAAISALNADRSDAAGWRSNFEKTFDAYTFLRMLSVRNVIKLWDTDNNYYFYCDPSEGGRIHWIPWDFDSALPNWDISGEVDDFFGAPLSLDMENIDESRRLIRYVLDDPVYFSKYIEYVESFKEGNFALESMTNRLKTFHDLIAPYVTGAEGELPEYSFTNAGLFVSEYDKLLLQIEARQTEVSSFLFAY